MYLLNIQESQIHLHTRARAQTDGHIIYTMHTNIHRQIDRQRDIYGYTYIHIDTDTDTQTHTDTAKHRHTDKNNTQLDGQTDKHTW